MRKAWLVSGILGAALALSVNPAPALGEVPVETEVRPVHWQVSSVEGRNSITLRWGFGESLRSVNWKPPHYLERQLRHCGVVTSGGFNARVTVFKVSCRKARRIVESYMRQGRPPSPVKIKGFPAWKCSSGSGLGTCRWHDKLGSQAPEIVFAWVP